MSTPEHMNEIGKETQFSSENQPANRGRKPGPISAALKEYGDADEILFVVQKKKNGQLSPPEAIVLSTTGERTLNQLIAAKLMQMSLAGDISAIKEVLNRTEGRVPQPINFGNSDDGPLRVEHEHKINYDDLSDEELDIIIARGNRKP